MNRGFYGYYERELQHLRGMAGEFAREFPKAAGRLALDQFECADPYVERLLEGFAFLAARVQYKYDAEFPRFTQSILSTIYPHFLAPTPSMLVAQFQPNVTDAGLAAGVPIARGTSLRSVVGKGERTSCEYQTAHAVNLLPIRIAQVDYYTRELSLLELPPRVQARAALRIRLETGLGMTFAGLTMDRLVFHIKGSGDVPRCLYEQIFGHGCGVLAQRAEKPVTWRQAASVDGIRQVGFDDDQALLPFGLRSFQGYRLLHEYFAFPQRFMFFELTGLQEAVRQCDSNQIDLVILMDQPSLDLENRVDASNLALFCTPAANLFSKRLDRIQLTDRFSEHHLVPDRTRPKDFEVYEILDITGMGERSDEERPFRPFYASSDLEAGEASGAYYVANRVPRVSSNQEKEGGRRSSYLDSEVYITLVDGKAAPFRSGVQQLAVRALCTNRDLPMQIPIGRGRTDFTMDGVAAVESVRCVAGPTPPRPACMDGEVAWRAISHLSLNYLSLADASGGQGAIALRDLLKLHADTRNPHDSKQIEGVLSVVGRPLTRRMPTNGPLVFARGVELTVTLDDAAFEDAGAFLLGAVLERFFAKYVSINSFTETVVQSKLRGEIKRWPTQSGLRHVL